jgi:hypothetical protein
VADNNNNGVESFALGVFVAVLVFIFFHRQVNKLFDRFASGGAGAGRGACGGGCGSSATGSACNCGGGTAAAEPSNPETSIGYNMGGNNGGIAWGGDGNQWTFVN